MLSATLPMTLSRIPTPLKIDDVREVNPAFLLELRSCPTTATVGILRLQGTYLQIRNKSGFKWAIPGCQGRPSWLAIIKRAQPIAFLKLHLIH